MLNDEDGGRAKEYEEVWRDWKAEPGVFRVWKLQEDGLDTGQEGGASVTGYFISMGLYAAGIAKNSRTGELGVSRWSKKDGMWVQEYAHGELVDWLPTPALEAGNHAPKPYTWWIIEQSND